MHHLFETALVEGRNPLEPEVLDIMADYGLPTPRRRWCSRGRDLAAASRDMGFPLVLKVVSRDILHKSDLGGVTLGLESPEDVETAWRQMAANLASKAPSAHDDGWLLVEQQKAGIELIAGLVHDQQFGTCLMLGVGGIFAEVMKDVSFRPLPIDTLDAFEMIGDLNSQALLNGVRGLPPVDRSALADLLKNLARLALENDRVVECDLNPVICHGERITIADARILLGTPCLGDMS